jgi:hypothetical protein
MLARSGKNDTPYEWATQDGELTQFWPRPRRPMKAWPTRPRGFVGFVLPKSAHVRRPHLGRGVYDSMAVLSGVEAGTRLAPATPGLVLRCALAGLTAAFRDDNRRARSRLSDQHPTRPVRVTSLAPRRGWRDRVSANRASMIVVLPSIMCLWVQAPSSLRAKTDGMSRRPSAIR